MPFLAVHVVLTCFLDLIQALTRSKQDQAVEILLLRQQLRIALRQAPPAPRLSRWRRSFWRRSVPGVATSPAPWCS